MIKLPPVTLPVTETVVPVCVVALTLAPPKMLPPVILPVADTCPAVRKFPESVLPVTLKLVKTPMPVATTPVNWLPLPKK